MQRRKKKISAALLLAFMFTMVFSTGAWAAFSDVASSHWAIQSLDRMSARGIIQGYEDGTARPNNPVTQFEAVVMAARVMGLDSKTGSVAKGTYLPFSYPSWSGAYELAVVAYENGLIDASDFTHGSSASREWIAKLLIKTMGQDSSVSAAAGEYLAFSDASAIGAGYLNYVKRANQLGLISGYTDGTFLPQKTVTRAEMAAFLSRAENQMTITASNVVIGTVATINGVNIGITGQNGISHSLYATTNSKLYNKDGQTIGVTGLTVGDPVYVVTKNSLLSYLEITDGAVGQVSTANLSGTITSIVSDKNTIIVTDTNGSLSTVLTDSKTTFATDQNKALVFSDLAVNDSVQITVDKQQLASKIIVVAAESSQSSGTIFNVDEYNSLITIEEKTGLRTYKMSNNISVSVSGMLTATPSSLKEGDVANYTVLDGLMTAIAVSGSSGSYGGNATFKSVDSDNKIINYTDSAGDLKADYYNNATTITFSDGEIGAIGDLLVGDSLQVTVSNGVISKIVIQNRSSSEGLKGTVYAIDRVNNILILEDSGGTKTTYDISSSVKVTLYGESSNLNAVAKDMKVEITLVNNKITKIKASDRVEGTVTAMNTSSSTITVRTDGIATLYDVSNAVTVYSYNSTSYRLSSVNIGDTVSLKIVNDEVTQIYIESKQDMTITSVYSNYIRVTDSSGNTKNLYLSDVDVIIDGIGGQNTSNLSTGDTLVATYQGNTLVEVNCTSQITGQITAINVNTNTLTVKTFANKTHTVSFTNNSYVVKNGANSNSMNTMTVGDRIIVSADSSSGRCFTVMSTRTSDLQYATTGILKFLNDNVYYKPINGCYVHYNNSTTQLEITKMSRNDSVTIYYTSDLQVYEIVKN